MKRNIFVAGALVAALSLGPGSALAGGEKATGGGQATNPGNNATATIGFNGKEGPKGPQGTVNVRVVNEDGTFNQHFVGDVDCYAQDGNRAWMSGEVKHLELGSNTNEGTYFQLAVEDGGEPGADMVHWQRDASPIDCHAQAPAPTFPLEQGNVQVH